MALGPLIVCSFFFFNDTATTEIYTLSLHDALPISPHVEYLRVIRDVLPRDGFFVEELCQAGFASYFAFPVYQPRTYVTPGFQGTLGFGFPTALGVKAAHPGRAVVSITGDGGFMFGVQDLATAVEHKLGVVVIVFNNGSLLKARRGPCLWRDAPWEHPLWRCRSMGAWMAAWPGKMVTSFATVRPFTAPKGWWRSWSQSNP